MREAIITAAVILCVAGCARLDEGSATRIPVGSGDYQKTLVTWKDIRERNVVFQRFDYSCGAAALATLLGHYFGDDVAEREVLASIVESLSEEELEKREKDGFSLLDLKNFAESRGYTAAGVRLQPEALPKLPGPILVYLKRKDYEHFAILRGMVGDRVYLADPSRGNIRMSIDRFLEEWSGIALVLGKPGFGVPKEHPLDLEEELPIRPELQIARRALQTPGFARSL